MTQKASKTPHRRHKPPLLKAEYLSLLQAGMSTNSGDELNLGNFHPHDHRDVHNLVELQSSTTAIVGARLSGPAQQGHRPPCQCTATGESLEDQGNLHLRHDRDVDDLVQIFDELQLWDLDCLHSCKRICWTCTTTSITLSMYCNGRISMVFCGISGPRESASAPRQRCRRPRNRNVLRRRDELNLRHLHCARTPRRCIYRDVHNRRNCTCGTPEHLSFTTTGMSPPCPRTGHPRQHLHSRDIDHQAEEEQQETQHTQPAPPRRHRRRTPASHTPGH